MTSKSSKGVKLSLGEFMGNGGVTSATSSLPKGPAERAPDDDGSFKRPVRRDNNYMDQPPSRSEGDGNWRRGGGTATSTGFGSSGGRSNYDSGDRSSGFDRGGGSGFDQRAGGYSRGSYADGGNSGSDAGASRGENWRGGSNARENATTAPSPASGERPRLQLKSRTLPMPEATPAKVPASFEPKVEPKDSSEGSANVTPESKKDSAAVVNDTPADEGKADVPAEEKATPSARPVAKEKPKREPDVINSRAAAFGGSNTGGSAKSEFSNARRDNQRSEQGPPPVLNSKFEKLADEERERKQEREGRRDRTSESDEGPLPVVNSRFAAAALADRSSTRPDDRGPPPVVNSRFAAAAEADRSSSKPPEDRGPPPVANSRFAAAAEADRSSMRSDDRGPPPVMNSRFAAAAEADRSTSYARNDDRGPPPVANSRFAAAAEADRSSNPYRDNADHGPSPVANSRFSAVAEADGRSAFNRDDRGPPPVANSRFAAAAAQADEEKMEFEDRRRERDNYYNRDGGQNRERVALPQNSRFAAAAAADSDYVDRDERERRFVSDRDRDGPSRDGRRPYDGGRYSRVNEEPPAPPVPTRVDELLKPKKQDDMVVVPLTKEHEANILKIPDKPLSKEEDTFLVHSKKKAMESPPKTEVQDKPEVASPAESNESILAFFSSGEKLGEELKGWCLERKLPPLEQLLFHMLKENEKLNPDPECGWAEPSKYGTALLALVEDNLDNQVQVLWAIQLYCESLGFPKLNGESVVQSMFRAMYKYDLAEADAFSIWKEDESDSHEKGKMTAIVQTIEWFNWLEADEDDDGEDEEEEEEGVEY